MTNIHIKTFGCSVNFSESEIMAGLLKNADFKLVNSPDQAAIMIINICTVKGILNAEKEIKNTKEKSPHIKLIIAGCISEDIIPVIKKIDPDASLVSTHNIKNIVSVVEETLHDNPIIALGKSNDVKLNLPRVRKNKCIAIIPISSGCLGNCSYCSVRLIKGKLQSYPSEAITDEVMAAVRNKCREIWLTSQDTGAYGKDIGSSLPELLQKITAIQGNFMLRIGMLNPDRAKAIKDDLIEAMKSRKIFKFLHLPVQSGNDDILKQMKRKYTVEEFKQLVNDFRKAIPDLTISTDIICGFPEESKEQFKDSLELIKDVQPDVINISRFSPRAGTKAARMKQFPSNKIKDRSRIITSAFDWIGFEQNKRWKNWEGNVLIDEIGKENTLIARNHAYRPIIIPNTGKHQIGDVIRVKVIGITKHDLRAEIVESKPEFKVS